MFLLYKLCFHEFFLNSNKNFCSIWLCSNKIIISMIGAGFLQLKIIFFVKMLFSNFLSNPKSLWAINGDMIGKNSFFASFLLCFLNRYVAAPVNCKTGPTKSKVALHLYGIIVIRSILNWYSYCNCYVINFVLFIHHTNKIEFRN